MESAAVSEGLASNPLWQQAQACLLEWQIAWREDLVRDGTRHALDAARTSPDDPETPCAVVAALLETGETVIARECLARPVLAESADPLVSCAPWRIGIG